MMKNFFGIAAMSTSTCVAIMYGACDPWSSQSEDPEEMAANPFDEGDPDIYKIKCNNNMGAAYFFKFDPGNPPSNRTEHHPDFMDPCMFLDPADAPTPTEGGDGWEDTAKAFCVSYCESLNVGYVDAYNVEIFPPDCATEHWSVEPIWDASNDRWATCANETPLLDFDEIENLIGLTNAEQMAELPCDLSSDCIDYLAQDEKLGLLTPLTTSPSYRDTADVLMETSVGNSLVRFLGGSYHAAEGHAAYSKVACAYDACPFYLAQFDLEATAAISVNVAPSSGSVTKSLSGFSVSLERPALGIWTTNSIDWVIFPPNSLSLRVDTTVSGTTNYLGENGSHSNLITVTEYSYGFVDGSAMELYINGDTFLGTWSVTASLVEE